MSPNSGETIRVCADAPRARTQGNTVCGVYGAMILGATYVLGPILFPIWCVVDARTGYNWIGVRP